MRWQGFAAVLVAHYIYILYCAEFSGKIEKDFFFPPYFVALFIFVKKKKKNTRAAKGRHNIFSRNIEGRKINKRGNEWPLMMDHFSKRDLFGKREKKKWLYIFVCRAFVSFICTFFFLHLPPAPSFFPRKTLQTRSSIFFFFFFFILFDGGI